MTIFTVVRVVSTNEADVNAVDEIIQSFHTHPLHGLVTYVVRLLFGHGNNVEVLESVQRTALANAAGNCHYQFVQFFIARDADGHALHNELGTTFIIAASQGHSGLIQLLIKHEADVNAGNRGVRTTLILVAIQCNAEAV